MKYYLFINIVLALFFISFFYLSSQFIKRSIDKRRLLFIIFYSIAVTIVFKLAYPFNFFGLEYEDAYVFNFSARQLSESIYPISFLTDGISSGSISNPISTVTYGGHFITYPVFISWFYSILGYNIYIPSFVNTLIEFFTIFTLSISFIKVFGKIT